MIIARHKPSRLPAVAFRPHVIECDLGSVVAMLRRVQASRSQWHSAGRAEMVTTMHIPLEIGGMSTLLRDETYGFHRHLPMYESGARARRGVALVKSR